MTETEARQEDASHAVRMDRMYRHQRHIYDLTRKYYLLGRDRAIEGLQLPSGGRLLEVGCGTGRNLLAAHRRYPDARLYGLDISAEMLASARRHFEDRAIHPGFLRADATRFSPADFGTDGFDRVLISYALSMIPDWEGAIDIGIAALAPCGSLHIVDFGQQEGLPRWFRSFLVGWLRRFHVTPRDGLQRALEERLEQADADMIFEEIFGGYAWHAILRKRGG
ncbi:class I SAM-dependent methyltransferase [Pseudorhizobium flavum]|uniref:S-adenosylmethionine-diacylgycerolhomoserine-N-methyltransferase n=1 Tax=Pseudorhizobium flavum TaxID=1335061 RepID=A0A7W9YUN3_9HYPH|nr:class I SAM-dependent methyltransferase [Pseudorhizobium flavum]MBB6178612.1 S-adenosylmethionine-diacylgycerolhomoserine-N-methyltransferase [Pseudorhizobium flavum]CAD6609832.1 class I SAM-dependent methyltransferase [Pseudorhizobium flavum]